VDDFLRAFIVYNAQLMVIVAVTVIAEALARVTDPRARVCLWRGVALAGGALPLSALAGPEALGLGVTYLVASTGQVVAPANGGFAALRSIVWWVLAGGAMARLAWLGAGALRLRQIRQRSQAAVLLPELEQLHADIAPGAEVRVSDDVGQPAAFGLRNPVILLPGGFFTMEADGRRAVFCHELLHVARRDWLWILLEEVARALFWFNPAVGWLVERFRSAASRSSTVSSSRAFRQNART
jgi:beta-lactamase regulating signal transducer with metallopeptidase domain